MDTTANASGVDYAGIDGFKQLAMELAAPTSRNLEFHGFSESPGSRGKSAYGIETIKEFQGGIRIGSTPEGLGTKSLVAQKMQDMTGNPRWWSGIGQDAVAMIVNDLITEKYFPLVVMQLLAAAEETWFSDAERSQHLLESWACGCNLARAAWGGGETPVLKDIIVPGTIDLCGAGIGLPLGGSCANDDDIMPGDSIVIFRSSGIHSNSLTRARNIGDAHGYNTVIDSRGTMFGAALLAPTRIYVPVIEDALLDHLPIHGLSNITGHGWKKLMRPERDLTYRITEVPDVNDYPEFLFMQEVDPKTLEQQYASLNMGAGFAAYLPADSAYRLIEIAGKHGIEAFVAGTVEEGLRQVIIEPVDVTYSELWAA